MNTFVSYRKAKNVAGDPRVAVSVTDPYDTSRYYAVRGRVINATTDRAAENIEEFSTNTSAPHTPTPAANPRPDSCSSSPSTPSPTRGSSESPPIHPIGADMTLSSPDPESSIPYVLSPGDSPAYWHVGTYWRVLADGTQTDGRSCTFDELCPRGLVAPLHVHDSEEEAFFVLEGDFVFTVDQDEITAGPGSYIYLPPGIRHGFRVESEVGRVYNTLTPAGFERDIIDNGTPAPRIVMPPPGSSALDVWRELSPLRPPAPWDAVS